MDPSYSTPIRDFIFVIKTPIRNFTFVIKAPIWNFTKLTALICSHWRYFAPTGAIFFSKNGGDDTDAYNKGWETSSSPKGET